MGDEGVVKAQRVLTDAFITHENERHHDVPWGVFGGGPGAVGKVDIYNVARPGEVKHMPAKFSGLRVPPATCTYSTAPAAAASATRWNGRPKKCSTTCSTAFAPSSMPAPPTASFSIRWPRPWTRRQPRRCANACDQRRSRRPPRPKSGAQRRDRRPRRRGCRAAPPGQPAATPAGGAAADRRARHEHPLAEVLRGLREAHGDAWSFEIVRHSAYGNTIEVVGELRANGSTVRESAAAAGGQGRSLGELLERAANDSLQKCVDTLLRNGR